MDNNSRDNGSFRHSFDAFQQVSIVLGDRIPSLCKNREIKFTANWNGVGEDYLFELVKILHLAEFCKVPVTSVMDEDGNLKGISFEIRDYPANKIVTIQKDDCGYIEVLDGDGDEWANLSYIVTNLTYEVWYHIEKDHRERNEKWEKEQKEAAMAN